jgi:glucose-6-phosphate 1-dehydrogenase
MDATSSDAFVFLGITGDLAYKQIFPALQAMIRRSGEWNVPLIGVASSQWALGTLKSRIRASLVEHGGGVDEPAFALLSERL